MLRRLLDIITGKISDNHSSKGCICYNLQDLFGFMKGIKLGPNTCINVVSYSCFSGFCLVF